MLVLFIISSNYSESKEIQCLRLYKDIKEFSRTPEIFLSESESLQQQKEQLVQYVENNCPDFEDLEFMYKAYIGNDLPK